jgi:uncharacterized protein YlxP (DUF503 family)
MEGFVAVMKIIVNQSVTGFFTVGANQFYNVSPVDFDGTEHYSVGVENVSFGVYRDREKAERVLQKIGDFINDYSQVKYRLEPDI